MDRGAARSAPPGAPSRCRFVSAICIWSLDVDAGRLVMPWDQLLLEVYGRALLMPTELFEPLDRKLPAHELAEHFGVPLEQVELRREDLAALQALER